MFHINKPASGEKISASIIRDNFRFLYNCTKTLSVIPTNPVSKSIYIIGGLIYFNNKNSTQLQILKIDNTQFDFERGFKTIINPDGTKYRVEIQHTGVSPFSISEAGYYREVAIILRNDGRFYFVEGSTTKEGISRPYDLCIYSDEIPIAILMLKHAGKIGEPHQIEVISEESILDVRPFVTTPFERDSVLADLEFNIDRMLNRIDRLEYNSIINDYFATTIDPFALPVDKKIYINPAKCYIDGRLIKFNGTTIDFTSNEFRPNFNRQGCFNSCLIYYDVIENRIKVIHGETDDCVVDYRNVVYPAQVRDSNGNLYVDNSKIPISIVIYRAATDAQMTREIFPITSYTHCGNIRISHKYNIIDIDNDVIKIKISDDVEESVFQQLFEVNSTNEQNIMIEDKSNIITRRVIVVLERDFVNKTKTVKLDRKILNIERYLSPMAIDLLWHRDVIEDVRPNLSI